MTEKTICFNVFLERDYRKAVIIFTLYVGLDLVKIKTNFGCVMALNASNKNYQI